ncbi:MAG: 23S rRNA (pseudouridine(1915)-N(3))-methyltransferase RlmH [Coriobacteriales bacterium]|jgi:23S rRNA (pseudouridine1915-N3)-methyltransferase|nr:23S rRNA (pseudouridine(1915)-N(3))-methyltransferase RlmH [Coriobacteriales bacterium]
MSSLKIDIIAVGKLKEPFWVAACAEYLKRMSSYANVQVKEVDDVSLQRASSPERVCELEAASICKLLASSTRLVVLDREGKTFSSEDIAALLENQLDGSEHHLSFVIGGSHGLAPELLKQAKLRLSLGAITLPHNLARVVLLEQLYRGFKIIRNEPYHK